MMIGIMQPIFMGMSKDIPHMVANLYGDLHINDRLQRSAKLDIAGVIAFCKDAGLDGADLAVRPDGTAVATPYPVQDSSMLAPLAKAGCLVIREPYAPAAAAGSRCSIVKLAF